MGIRRYLDISVKDPEPVRLDRDRLTVYAGRYETISMIFDVTVGDGYLILDFEERPEVLEQLGEEPADDPPEPPGASAG